MTGTTTIQALTREELLGRYGRMLLIRRFEERAALPDATRIADGVRSLVRAGEA